MTQEKIADRIRKLFRLAESDNVNEAANAAAQAQVLIDKHHIDMALLVEGQVEKDQGPIAEEIRHCKDFPMFTTGQRIATWKWEMLWNFCTANGVRPWSENEWDRTTGSYARTVYVIGRESDARTVQYMFQYVVREIDRLAKKHKGKGRTWLNNFRLGAVSAVGRTLNEKKMEQQEAMREEAEAQDRQHALRGEKTALVRLESAIAKVEERGEQTGAWMKFQKLKYSSGGSESTYDHGAFATGRKAGGDIGLGGGPALKGGE